MHPKHFQERVFRIAHTIRISTDNTPGAKFHLCRQFVREEGLLPEDEVIEIDNPVEAIIFQLANVQIGKSHIWASSPLMENAWRYSKGRMEGQAVRDAIRRGATR